MLGFIRLRLRLRLPPDESILGTMTAKHTYTPSKEKKTAFLLNIDSTGHHAKHHFGGRYRRIYHYLKRYC